ncbi:MAG: hypothetical protein J0L75_17020 [Spirochaetes bacterium]|nr:hypothetical protein [Spirochaetota bacterium]
MALPRVAILLIPLFSLLPAAVNARLADDFAGPARELSGRKTTQGGRLWKTEGTLVLDGKGAVRGEAGGNGWIEFAGPETQITLSAELEPAGSEWVALAFGGNLDHRYFTGASLWCYLRPGGAWSAHADGTKVTLGSGKVPPRSRSSFLLRYDRVAHAVTLTIDGIVVLDQKALGTFRPDLKCAGFRIQGKDPQSRASVSGFAIEGATLREGFDGITQAAPLAIYAPEETARLAVHTTLARKAKVAMECRAFQGAGQTQVAEAGIGEGKHCEFMWPNLPTGWYECVAKLVGEDGALIDASRTTFAVLPRVSAPAAAENPFGAMVFPHVAYPKGERDRDADMMQRIGLRWVRTHRINWLHIQTGPEKEPVWTEADAEVERYRERGLSIIATTFWPTPPWASQARDEAGMNKGAALVRPEYLPMAEAFARNLAARYRGRIAVYEIGNEVDAFFWTGSLSNYLHHDALGIVRDYTGFFARMAGGLHAGDPGARVAPNTTSHLPEGHTYRPWLDTALAAGLGKSMDLFSTHYAVDMAVLNGKLSAVRPGLPVIFTELGGIQFGASNLDPRGDEMKRLIREDWRQAVGHLRYANVKALCKFLLREQNDYGGEGRMTAGLLENDFNLRPSFVAWATLVRTLAGARFVKEPNLAGVSDRGWVEAYAFQRDGRTATVLFLNLAPRATLVLPTPDASLTLLDPMGTERPLVAKGARASFEMDGGLPMVVFGRIQELPGNFVPPTNTLLSVKHFDLPNAGFEEAGEPQSVPGWKIYDTTALSQTPPRLVPAIVSRGAHGGKRCLELASPTRTLWDGIAYDIPVSELPALGEGEYLVFKVSLFAKGEAVKGMGLGYTLAFRKADGDRLNFRGSPYFGFGGTFDWKELAGQEKIERILPGSAKLAFEILLGKSSGTVWVDDVRLSVEHWKKPAL